MHTVEEPEVLTWDFPRGTASVAIMVEFAAEHGVTTKQMLAGTGLTAKVLADPDAQIDARIELGVVRNLVRELAAVPALSVEVGRRYRISTFGIFGFACVTSPTLREAISLALRFIRLGFAFCTPIVESRDDELIAWMHDELIPDDVRQFLVERDVVAMHRVMSDLLGRHFALARVEFGFAEPTYAEHLHAMLGVRPRFGLPHTMFALDSQVLTRPLPQANEPTWAVCVAQCRELVHRRSARSGVAAEVRDRLVPGSGVAGIKAVPSIDVVARELNMSIRTLRRRLEEAGTSYRALLDEVRRALAEELLVATPLSVDDVAIRLGYAEATPFIYAFKRWTGVTPAAYRRSRGPGRKH